MSTVDNIVRGGSTGEFGVSLPDGSASSPALSFQSAPSSGLYFSSFPNNRVNVSANGTTVIQFAADAITCSRAIQAADGTISAPGISFTTSSDVGFYVPQAHSLSVVGDSTALATFNGIPAPAGFVDANIEAMYTFETDFKDQANSYDLIDIGGTVLSTNVTDSVLKTVPECASFAAVSTLNNSDAGLMAFTLNTTFTIALVFRANDISLNRGIVQFHTGVTVNRLRIGTETGAARILLDTGTNYLGIFTPALSTDVWYHIAVVVDNANIQPVRVYLNTVEPLLTYDIGNSTTTYIPFTSDDFVVGAFATTPSGRFNGDVGYVTCTTTAWDSGLVNAHYNSIFGVGETYNTTFHEDVVIERDAYMYTGAGPGLILHGDASGRFNWDNVAWPFTTSSGVVSLNVTSPANLICCGTYNNVEAHGTISMQLLNVDNFDATIDIDINALTSRSISTCYGVVSFSTNATVIYTGYIVANGDNMRVIFNNGYVVPGGGNSTILHGSFHIIFT